MYSKTGIIINLLVSGLEWALHRRGYQILWFIPLSQVNRDFNLIRFQKNKFLPKNMILKSDLKMKLIDLNPKNTLTNGRKTPVIFNFYYE
jgi:hypothetical protein